jgi:hypothetical protein
MPGSSSESGRECIPDQRQVEVARARAVGVERRAILPAAAGDGAAANDYARAGRNVVANDAQEVVEALLAAAEHEANEVGALLFVGQLLLGECGIIGHGEAPGAVSEPPAFGVSSTKCRSSSLIRA